MSQRALMSDEFVDGVKDDQLLEAVLLCALQYGDACRRVERHRKRFGYDYRCSRMLDDVALKKSLLHLLAVEAQTSGARIADGGAVR